MTRWACLLLGVLLLARVPSLVQPAGADQGLYTYVGARILDGGLPYRDAWDQKPPAVHFTYALLYGLWPRDSMVSAADLVVAAAVALLLVPLGRQLGPGPAAGIVAACLFLLLGDPTFNRLAGVRIRAQCETFIGLAMTGALLLAAGPGSARKPAAMFGAGLLAGIAFTFKYNAIVYGAVLIAAIAARSGVRQAWRRAPLLAAGAILPAAVLLTLFAINATIDDLYQATVRYNLEYSGETYEAPWSFCAYLLTFPVRQARIDALWTLGGLGCLVLIAAWTRERSRWMLLLPVAWVAMACLSIAINGSRGLPQYFVQANPALALAAGVAAAHLWPAAAMPARWRPLARIAAIGIVATAVWRVNDFRKIPANAAHDLAYLAGRTSREEHLMRYGGQRNDKYSALAVHRLGLYLGARTPSQDYVYIFGFSPGAYVKADRASASRFFWSRPVLVGFNADDPAYGAAGVLEELTARSPKFVVLQKDDWEPAPDDSATFFLEHPQLGSWLRSNYTRRDGFEDFDVWERAARGAVRTQDVSGDGMAAAPRPRERSIVSTSSSFRKR